VTELWSWIEGTELAFQIGATWWFPLLESIHVLGLATLLGSIFMQDLRLIGWSARQQDPELLALGMTPWVLLGFVLALVTGLGMFVSRPSAYAANPAFQAKLILLLAAGLNLFMYRLVAVTTARVAAGLSLVIWFAVVLAGRWIGHIM
jgi:hypothetical protein